MVRSAEKYIKQHKKHAAEFLLRRALFILNCQRVTYKFVFDIKIYLAVLCGNGKRKSFLFLSFSYPFSEHFHTFVSYGIRGNHFLPVEFTAKHSEPNAAVLLNSTLDSPPNSLSQCNKGLFRTEVLRLFRVSPFVHLQYSTYLLNVNSFFLIFIKFIYK